MADDSGIDPRYAAQFQRGYDPTRHRAAPPPEPRVDAGPPRLPGGPVTHAERVPERPEPRRIPMPNATVAVADAAEEPVDEVEPDRRRFRWEWMLPALGVVLLVAAAAVIQSALAAYDSAGPTSYILFVVQSALPGPLVVAAVIAFTAWLVLRGMRSGTR